MEHMAHIKKIKELVGEFLGEIAEEKKVSGSNIAVVKEALSAYEKACGGYGARRRDARGRYMDGRGNAGGSYGGWMPGPYYAGSGYGADNASMAAELERIASSGSGSEGMATALREAARWLRISFYLAAI